MTATSVLVERDLADHAEPTCRHGYQPDPGSPEEELRGRAGAADEAHQATCPRAATFWHPRWEWLEYLPAVERVGLVVCCVGCREQVTP